jgi:hypothetical protein
MKETSTSCSEPRRPCELLRIAERRAVAIRKKLNSFKQTRDFRFRGVMDDAVKLAETIEILSRFGQTSSAEEAVEIKFRIEILLSLLEGEVDQIIAS